MTHLKYKNIHQTSINSLLTLNSNDNSDSYILIDKRFLHIDDKLEFELYVKDKLTQMSLFLQSDTIIDETKKKIIQELEQLYILDTQKDKYNDFKEEHLRSIVSDETLSIDEKTEVIYTTTTDLTDSLYNNPNALKNVQLSKKIVTPILESILHNNNTIASYIKIIEFDYYTHTHSLNVSIYTLCLGERLGLDKELLKHLGQAALLHDLGKSKINKNIINKNSQLANDEFEQMKTHPALGFDIASSIGIKNKDILDGIRHHHEKLNGRGYPDHLKGDEISLFPRIIGVCDIFDALTTRRSYKAAMKSYDALMLMRAHMSTHIDMDILSNFIKMLHK